MFSQLGFRAREDVVVLWLLCVSCVMTTSLPCSALDTPISCKQGDALLFTDCSKTAAVTILGGLSCSIYMRNVSVLSSSLRNGKGLLIVGTLTNCSLIIENSSFFVIMPFLSDNWMIYVVLLSAMNDSHVIFSGVEIVSPYSAMSVSSMSNSSLHIGGGSNISINSEMNFTLPYEISVVGVQLVGDFFVSSSFVVSENSAVSVYVVQRNQTKTTVCSVSAHYALFSNATLLVTGGSILSAWARHESSLACSSNVGALLIVSNMPNVPEIQTGIVLVDSSVFINKCRLSAGVVVDSEFISENETFMNMYGAHVLCRHINSSSIVMQHVNVTLQSIVDVSLLTMSVNNIVNSTVSIADVSSTIVSVVPKMEVPHQPVMNHISLSDNNFHGGETKLWINSVVIIQRSSFSATLISLESRFILQTLLTFSVFSALSVNCKNMSTVFESIAISTVTSSSSSGTGSRNYFSYLMCSAFSFDGITYESSQFLFSNVTIVSRVSAYWMTLGYFTVSRLNVDKSHFKFHLSTISLSGECIGTSLVCAASVVQISCNSSAASSLVIKDMTAVVKQSTSTFSKLATIGAISGATNSLQVVVVEESSFVIDTIGPFDVSCAIGYGGPLPTSMTFSRCIFDVSCAGCRHTGAACLDPSLITPQAFGAETLVVMQDITATLQITQPAYPTIVGTFVGLASVTVHHPVRFIFSNVTCASDTAYVVELDSLVVESQVTFVFINCLFSILNVEGEANAIVGMLGICKGLRTDVVIQQSVFDSFPRIAPSGDAADHFRVVVELCSDGSSFAGGLPFTQAWDEDPQGATALVINRSGGAGPCHVTASSSQPLLSFTNSSTISPSFVQIEADAAMAASPAGAMSVLSTGSFGAAVAASVVSGGLDASLLAVVALASCAGAPLQRLSGIAAYMLSPFKDFGPLGMVWGNISLILLTLLGLRLGAVVTLYRLPSEKDPLSRWGLPGRPVTCAAFLNGGIAFGAFAALAGRGVSTSAQYPTSAAGLSWMCIAGLLLHKYLLPKAACLRVNEYPHVKHMSPQLMQLLVPRCFYYPARLRRRFGAVCGSVLPTFRRRAFVPHAVLVYMAAVAAVDVGSGSCWLQWLLMSVGPGFLAAYTMKYAPARVYVVNLFVVVSSTCSLLMILIEVAGSGSSWAVETVAVIQMTNAILRSVHRVTVMVLESRWRQLRRRHRKTGAESADGSADALAALRDIIAEGGSANGCEHTAGGLTALEAVVRVICAVRSDGDEMLPEGLTPSV